MNKKQGFTLIELLAVIVILAVIALIATPLIMRVIDEAKKGAAKNSANGIIEAGTLKLGNDIKDMTSGSFSGKIYTEESDLEFKGTKPSKFILKFNEEGQTEFQGFVSGYCIVKGYTDSGVRIDENKKTAEECVSGSNQEYANGDVIYFNPVTEQKCSTYTETNSLHENKTGCLKWYAFNDTEASDTVSLILDHNTTKNAHIVDLGGYSVVSSELESLVNENHWKYQPRLITANEIAQITGNNNFDSNIMEKSNPYFLETNSQEIPSFIDMENPNASAQGKAKYAWLFDYTVDCHYYGCNIAEQVEEKNRAAIITVDGYWTATSNPFAEDYYWVISKEGALLSVPLYGIGNYGVRPVITISKVLLK